MMHGERRIRPTAGVQRPFAICCSVKKTDSKLIASFSGLGEVSSEACTLSALPPVIHTLRSSDAWAEGSPNQRPVESKGVIIVTGDALNGQSATFMPYPHCTEKNGV